jgi:hypothetical protein
VFLGFHLRKEPPDAEHRRQPLVQWSVGSSQAKLTGRSGLISRRGPPRGCHSSVAPPLTPARVSRPPARATRKSNVSSSVNRRRAMGWCRAESSARRLLVIAEGETSSRMTYTDSTGVESMSWRPRRSRFHLDDAFDAFNERPQLFSQP